MPRTLVPALAVAAVLSGAASARVDAVQIVHRGQVVHVVVRPGGTQDCLLALSFSDQHSLNEPTKSAVLGKVSWTITIPRNAPLGPAGWIVRCGPTWSQSGSWRIVAAPVAAPAVTVAGSGFSQRPDPGDPGSKVSFGVFLRNTSLKRDATKVYVLVGFVDAKGRLVGSTAKTLAAVNAGQTFAYGGSATLGSRVAVRKLEITVRVGSSVAAGARPQLHFANVTVVADQRDPGFVSEVDGELSNDASSPTLASAQLSIVVLNASGAIVGGGTASVASPVPAGARIVFAAQSGLSAISASKGASAVVSATPHFTG